MAKVSAERVAGLARSLRSAVAGRGPEADYVSLANEQSGGRVAEISAAVMTQVEKILTEMGASYAALSKGLPTEAMVAVGKDRFEGSKRMRDNLPGLGRMLADALTLQTLATAGLRKFGETPQEAYPFMRAIADGVMLSTTRDGDGFWQSTVNGVAGRIETVQKTRRMNDVDLPLALFPLSEVPQMRELMDMCRRMATQWLSLVHLESQMEDGHDQIEDVVRQLGEEQAELAVQVGSLSLRIDDIAVRLAKSTVVRDELARKLLVANQIKMSGEDATRLTTSFSAVDDECHELNLKLMEAELERGRNWLRIVEASIGRDQGSKNQQLLHRQRLALSVMEQLLHRGVLTITQGLARLVAAGASALLEAKLYASQGLEYDINDPEKVFGRALQELAKLTSGYQELIDGTTRQVLLNEPK